MPVDFHLHKQLPSPKPNPEVDFWLYDRYLEKMIWRHNFAADSPITTKFDRMVQNDFPKTINRSKSKLEVQFQYGGRPFSETGSSFILAVDWDISSKFGVQIDMHLLKRVPLWNLNQEADFLFYGRHLEKSIWRHNSAANRWIATKIWEVDAKWHPDTHWSKSKPEVQFQYGGFPFSETGK